MQEIVLAIISKWGYIGVMLLIFIENIFPPIPSEVILLFGGFIIGYTSLNLIMMFLFATIGSLLGAIVLYYLGRILSVEKIKRIVKGRVGKVLRLREEDIDKANLWFEKKNSKAVFICRFLPIVRSLISIPAGMSNMNMIQFIIFTLLGSLIWNVLLIFIGNRVGNNWEVIANVFNEYSLIITIFLASLVTIFIISFYLKRVKEERIKNK